MISDEFMEYYGDIEAYLILFDNSKTFRFKEKRHTCDIYIKAVEETINLSEKDLTKLCHGDKLKKTGLNYIGDYGFTYQKFGEISISVFNPKYAFINESEEWIPDPLKFKIDNKLFEIGPASPLFVLLNEPIYKNSDWQYDFQNFTTIKATNTGKENIKDDIVKALYYLNSYYLKSTGLAARVYHMKIVELDSWNLWENDSSDILQKVNRVRIRSRNNFISIEPLILYNHAQSSEGDEKFLTLYRILEFFMQRAKIKKVNEQRYDTNIPDLLLIKTIELGNEEMYLENLVKETLTISQKKKMSNYAYNKRLIKENDYKYLAKALYKFRNSIVHAKEQQISDTKIPDPFEQDYGIYPWIYIADEIVIRCIRKYNNTSG